MGLLGPDFGQLFIYLFIYYSFIYLFIYLFLKDSALLDVRHYHKLQSCTISRKFIDANLRKWEKNLILDPGTKPNFVPKFGPEKIFLQILPVLDVRYCRKLIIVCNFKERVWSKLNKMAKNRILDLQIRAANFFFKNLASLVTKYHGQLSSCTISDKTNDPILKSLSSDRRTDGREWFHRTLSN